MRPNIKHFVIEVVSLVVGNAVLAFAVGMFILPSNILSGGVAGISLLISPFISLDESIIVLILSVGLLLVGGVFLGGKFVINSCVSSVLYPLILIGVEYFFEPPELEPILAAVFGGLLSGVGVGVVVRQGASTGGMDIPPLIINKLTGYDVSKAVMITDALTVLAGLFVYGLEEVLIGLIAVFLSGQGVRWALTYGRGSSAKELQIISDDYEVINQEILVVLERGTTLLEASGGYTNDKKKVLLVVVSQSEYQKVLDIVNRHDPDAFIIVFDATDVHGLGFSDIVRI